jgi:hypothetical protein
MGCAHFSGEEFMFVRQKKLLLLIPVALALTMVASNAFGQAEGLVTVQAVDAVEPSQRPKLSHATMCERVDNLAPTRPGVAFSVSMGQVCCYTSFDPVPQPTLIFHRWYHRDELSTQTRLRVYPPKWATYSVIQLRETDKGPWRVEITDQSGRVFNVLRFSITD